MKIKPYRLLEADKGGGSDPTPTPEPERHNEDIIATLRARIEKLESDLAQCARGDHTHEPHHTHDTDPPTPPTPRTEPKEPDKPPTSTHFWFRKIGG